MTTQAQEKSCEELCSLLDGSDEFLSRTTETIQSDSVVMEEDGSLRYRNLSHDNHSSWLEERREELNKKRKELVLGINDFDKHSLSEANQKIDEEWREFRDKHTSSVGKAVSFIKGHI